MSAPGTLTLAMMAAAVYGAIGVALAGCVPRRRRRVVVFVRRVYHHGRPLLILSFRSHRRTIESEATP